MWWIYCLDSHNLSTLVNFLWSNFMISFKFISHATSWPLSCIARLLFKIIKINKVTQMKTCTNVKKIHLQIVKIQVQNIIYIDIFSKHKKWDSKITLWDILSTKHKSVRTSFTWIGFQTHKTNDKKLLSYNNYLTTIVCYKIVTQHYQN